MAFTESREIIAPAAVEVETTYNDATMIDPATDGFNSYESPIKWQSNIAQKETRNHGTSFTNRKDTIGVRLVDINAKSKMQYSGAAGTEVQGLFDMFRGSGATVTSPASNNLIKPSTVAALESVVFASVQGVTGTAKGSYFNCILSASSGDPIAAEFTGQGLYAAPTLAGLSGWAVGATGVDRALPFLNIGITIDNGTDIWTGATVTSFRHDFGNRLTSIPDANSSTGLKKILFVDRNPTLDLVIVMDLDTSGTIIQANEFFSDHTGSVTHAIDFAVDGGAGNTLTFDYPTAQLVGEPIQSADGYLEFALRYKLQSDTDEAEWSITCT